MYGTTLIGYITTDISLCSGGLSKFQHMATASYTNNEYLRDSDPSDPRALIHSAEYAGCWYFYIYLYLC